MKASSLIRFGACAALLAAGGAYAQSLTPVLTDVNPLPAEDRDSVGAVVLQDSMVRAQRAVYIASRSRATSVEAVAGAADRATRRAQTKEDLKALRDDDQMRLHEMGAGSLNPP
jgi:hypothetical protein